MVTDIRCGTGSVASRCSTKTAEHRITDQCCTTDEAVWFFEAKDLHEIRTKSSQGGAKYRQVG